MAIEAELVARHVLSLRDEGLRLGDIAILLPRFTHLQRYLLPLQRAGIPYYVVRGRGFYESMEVRDLASVLRLLDDPDDTLALISVLRSPLCGISDEGLLRLHLAGGLRLSALMDPARALPEGLEEGERERLLYLVEMLRHLLLRGDRLGPQRALEALLDASDLAAVLAAAPDGEQRIANLEHLLLRAREFALAGRDIRAFARYLARAVDPSWEAEAAPAQIVDERDDVLRVMTVHQAKGLEFEVVVIPGCASPPRAEVGRLGYDRDVGLGLCLRRGGERVDTLPQRQVRRLVRQRAEAESRRLFYVAATRARQRVIFAGEGARRRSTWRAHLDAFLRSPAASLLERVSHAARESVQWVEAEHGPATPMHERADGATDEDAARVVARVYRYPAPAPGGPPLRLRLDAAVDLCLCPRRFSLAQRARLREHGAAPAQAALARRMLSRIGAAQGEADLDALIVSLGQDPRRPEVAEARARVLRFLQTCLGEELSRRLGRARPFLLRAIPFQVGLDLAGGSRVDLDGEFDLVLAGEDGDPGALRILDYDHGARPASDEAPGIRRALLAPRARALIRSAQTIDVAVCHLGEPDPSPIFRRSAPHEEEAALARLGAALGLASVEARAEALPGLPEERCLLLGCGYRARCHPGA